jgi:hypothetical protein
MIYSILSSTLTSSPFLPCLATPTTGLVGGQPSFLQQGKVNILYETDNQCTLVCLSALVPELLVDGQDTGEVENNDAPNWSMAFGGIA